MDDIRTPDATTSHCHWLAKAAALGKRDLAAARNRIGKMALTPEALVAVVTHATTSATAGTMQRQSQATVETQRHVALPPGQTGEPPVLGPRIGAPISATGGAASPGDRKLRDRAISLSPGTDPAQRIGLAAISRYGAQPATLSATAGGTDRRTSTMAPAPTQAGPELLAMPPPVARRAPAQSDTPRKHFTVTAGVPTAAPFLLWKDNGTGGTTPLSHVVAGREATTDAPGHAAAAGLGLTDASTSRRVLELSNLGVVRQTSGAAGGANGLRVAPAAVARAGASNAPTDPSTAATTRRSASIGQQNTGALQQSLPSAGPGNSGPGNEPAGRHGPTEGDVYLDGTLVGRWMARTMGQSAARPPTGGSAFDATRNRLPPGTMIGT